MANPFPGMDPYLEGNFWPVVHAHLGTDIARALNATIRPKYVALTMQRVVLTFPEDAGFTPSRWTDVGVVRNDNDATFGGTAVATPPLLIEPMDGLAVPQYEVEICDAASRRLVTAIEVLSPTNKSGSGRDEYMAKRLELLAGPANLVEVDLLTAGARFPLRQAPPYAPYFVFVSRANRRSPVEVWPVSLREPIPKVPVPLAEGDADVWLDLQTILNRLHDEMGYDLSVNYREPPTATFPADDLAWIDDRMRAAGLRS